MLVFQIAPGSPRRAHSVLTALERISVKLDRVIEILEEEDLTESPRT
jgi:hypothetical protein